MATTMTKSTTGAKTAGPSKQYLKKGGKVSAKPSSKMMYGGMKKGGTKKGM